LSEANATAGAAGTVAPLVIGAAVVVGLGWRAGLLVTVVLAAVVFGVFRTVRLPPPTVVEAAGRVGGARSLPRRYWITWGVLVCVIATEFCLSLWATDLLRTRDDLGPGAATAGLSAVLVGMTVSRFAGGRLGLRHTVDWLLVRSMAVLLVGFAAFWATTEAAVAFAALGVCGLGLGLLYPLTISRAVAAAEGRSDLAATRASLGAGAAIAVGPFLLGALADHVGEHAAFLPVPLLIAAAVVGLTVSRPVAPARQEG
jgi:fucose permease